MLFVLHPGIMAVRFMLARFPFGRTMPLAATATAVKNGSFGLLAVSIITAAEPFVIIKLVI